MSENRASENGRTPKLELLTAHFNFKRSGLKKFQTRLVWALCSKPKEKCPQNKRVQLSDARNCPKPK